MKKILSLTLMASFLFASAACGHRHGHRYKPRHPRKVIIIVEQSVQVAAPQIA